MEVTKEMIEAVAAHEREQAKAYERECAERWRKWWEEVDNRLKGKIRALLPDITDAQIDVLSDIYNEYFDEMR